MNITLGGDRLGSGNKNKIHLRNYERSTHNLSERFTSTAGCGMLIPCLVKPVLRGDVFDININGACRTLPTQSPMFSTFKMQTDIFFAPVRLYQGILHNNPLFIGLKMSDVKFPKVKIYQRKTSNVLKHAYLANNCLMKYLGLSGIGRSTAITNTTYSRDINAIPMLAYYDIFKNYYANKQEDNAYVLSSQVVIEHPEYLHVDWVEDGDGMEIGILNWHEGYVGGGLFNKAVQIEDAGTEVDFDCQYGNVPAGWTGQFSIVVGLNPQQATWYSITQAIAANHINQPVVQDGHIKITTTTDNIFILWKDHKLNKVSETTIVPFPLDNIDTMRLNLLSHHTLGTPYTIKSDYEDLPYSMIASAPDADDEYRTQNEHELCGLALKTYQSDLFNTWLNTEWIDGENGIAEMSKIAVQDGSIYMDALILAEKTFKMLNRIAVAGGTYEAWQDVVYQESDRKHIESPVYCGGQSYEVVFEEIVQTTPTEGAPLGTLGGRGLAVKRKGGSVSIKVDEAGFIIGIVSITPRVYYTQGNEFYLTELDSMDDLHKPALDGIGFQNLLGERMVCTDTILGNTGTPYSRTKVGKVPAWIEYMTAVDKAYGEFCDLSKQGSMILGRHYETNASGEVQDFTTYIDPSKYNYAFGDRSLTAQNFWIQIDFDIKARRLMSAKQIPNL